MILDKFVKYLENEAKSKNTIDSYVRHIKAFFEFMQIEEAEFDKLKRVSILEYKSYLMNIKKCKPKTVNAKLSAISTFNKFLIEENVVSEMLISKKDLIKIQEQYVNPTTITEADVTSFRNRILNQKNKRASKRKEDVKYKHSDKFHDFKTIRDYCIATFLAYGGLRISECLDLQLSDFESTLPNGDKFVQTNRVIVRNGKGEKAREFIMLDQLVEPLKEYLKVRNSDSPYLFYSRENDKLDRSTVNKLFNDNSDNITPHTLRHFLASWLINVKGFSVGEAMYITGHKDVRTLMIYTNPNEDQLREKLRKY